MPEDTPEENPEQDPEPEKPRFLLPDGCKDLIDVIRLQQQDAPHEIDPSGSGASASPEPPWNPPKTVLLPDPVVVKYLASALRLEPYRIIHTLMELNTFTSINAQLDFAIASKVCSRYGVTASNAA